MNVFKSEIGTEINIDAITSVAIICDEYGATIQESGKIHYSWYRVCVKDKDKDVSGGYGDEAAGWITIDDFSKLKPVLLKQGWLFHRSRTGAPWYAEGEAGARPSKACVSDRASVHDSAIGESFLPLPLVNVSVLDLDDHKAAIQELIEGRIDSARHILQRVRERYPRDLQVYKRLARLEIAQRDWNEAVYSIMMWLELLVYEIRQNKGVPPGVCIASSPSCERGPRGSTIKTPCRIKKPEGEKR